MNGKWNSSFQRQGNVVLEAQIPAHGQLGGKPGAELRSPASLLIAFSKVLKQNSEQGSQKNDHNFLLHYLSSTTLTSADKKDVYCWDKPRLPPAAPVFEGSVNTRNTLPVSLPQTYYHSGSSLNTITFNYKNKNKLNKIE